MTDDLWPQNIADSTLTTPITLLKQQGALLGEKTRQMVTVDVVTQTNGNLFVHYFYIVAPTLNYRFELFAASHGINFYPIAIRHANHTTSVHNEDDFKAKLKELLSSPYTVNVVHSILAQVRS